ncbi:MAG: hypothetical protein ACOZBZ_04420 [Patescibacteria group bacterium]
MELSNLLSGLIGAVIGGLLSYFGSIKAAEKSIKAVYEQESEKRKEEEEKARASTVKRLLAEVNENLALTENIMVNNAKIRFITEAWSTAKGDIYFLSEELQENLQKSYTKIHRYNVLVDYDLGKVSYGGGFLDQPLLKAAEEVKEALLSCKDKLESWRG